MENRIKALGWVYDLWLFGGWTHDEVRDDDGDRRVFATVDDVVRYLDLPEPTDVRVIDSGSLVGLHILTDEAEAWIADNVASEGWQWMGNILWVDHRMAGPVIEGMQAGGLICGA